MKIEEIIKSIIEEVISLRGFTLYGIFLFGSRVKPDFKEDSDFDILVIIEDELSKRDIHKLTAEILILLHKQIRFISFDVIIKSRKNFEEEKDIVNTISNEVFHQGIGL